MSIWEDSSQERESDAIVIESTENRSAIKQPRKSDAIVVETSGSSAGNRNIFKPLRRKLWRTRICGYWERGHQCPYGDKCRYAHGQSELQPRDPSFAADHRLNTPPIPAQPPVIDSSKSKAATSRPDPAQRRSVLIPSSASIGVRPRESRYFPQDKKIVGIYADWLEN